MDANLGESLGEKEGLPVGDCGGLEVGLALGLVVGDVDGNSLGLVDGLALGDSDGTDGLALGAGVGTKPASTKSIDATVMASVLLCQSSTAGFPTSAISATNPSGPSSAASSFSAAVMASNAKWIVSSARVSPE